jgi:hypothetical protein
VERSASPLALIGPEWSVGSGHRIWAALLRWLPVPLVACALFHGILSSLWLGGVSGFGYASLRETCGWPLANGPFHGCLRLVPELFERFGVVTLVVVDRANVVGGLEVGGSFSRANFIPAMQF